MDRLVHFYYCIPIIHTVLEKQACNIYKYWSYNRNLSVHYFNTAPPSSKTEITLMKVMTNGKEIGQLKHSLGDIVLFGMGVGQLVHSLEF